MLDEATSALDAAAQAKVVEAYAEVMSGRTTVVISHREEVVRSADRVVVVEGGRVVSPGRSQARKTPG